MSKKTYETLTTVSLFFVAASAILSDKFVRYSWLFGAIAVVCTLVSTWIYFKHGMKKTRERAQDGEHSVDAADEPVRVSSGTAGSDSSFEVSKSPIYLECNDLVASDETDEMGGAEDVCDEAQPTSGLSLGLSALQVKSYYISSVIVKQHQRTFAEEVVEIVKGLTDQGENPVYEFEFKPDGSLRVVPCASRGRRPNKSNSIAESLEEIDLENRTLH
jgi:hypothetical protein